jgi:hypothetical protein
LPVLSGAVAIPILLLSLSLGLFPAPAPVASDPYGAAFVSVGRVPDGEASWGFHAADDTVVGQFPMLAAAFPEADALWSKFEEVCGPSQADRIGDRCYLLSQPLPNRYFRSSLSRDEVARLLQLLPPQWENHGNYVIRPRADPGGPGLPVSEDSYGIWIRYGEHMYHLAIRIITPTGQ